jgi:REP-associated tyrosine transposase
MFRDGESLFGWYEQLRFFNPNADIRHTENRLPHWQQKGAVYFVTFRLADAIPENLLSRWETKRECWLRLHPQPRPIDVEQEYHRRFSSTIDRWLDAGHGSCLLRERENPKLMANALQHFDGVHYAQIAWLSTASSFSTQTGYWNGLPHSWKLFSARRINKRTECSGTLWQRDYFDRLVRDQRHLANCTAVFAAIRRKRVFNPEITCCMKATLPGASSEQPTAWALNKASFAGFHKNGG